MKTILKITLILLLTFIQSYWAMYPYRLSPDSYSMHNSYFIETLYMSLLFTAFLIPIVFITSFFRIFQKHQHLILLTFLIPVWYLINYGNYDGRVASWSTFSPNEINGAVISHSFLPITICTIIFIFTYKYLFQNKTIKILL